jgi:DNA-binding IclR family transcriptional regulator
VKNQQGRGPVIRAVSRAIAVLQAFDEARLELGVTELSRVTDIDKSTVYRLLNTLQQGGLIEQNPATAKYHLGFGLLHLAGLALQKLDLPRIVRPYLEELAELSQETVNLAVMTNDDQIINIDVITSSRSIRHVGWIGRTMPAHAVSGGKVIMAFLPDERLGEILARGLKPYTERTITDRAELQEELERIRQVGYGIVEEELEIDLNAVAAPIRNHEGTIVALISISGPAFRMSRERLVELGQMTKRTTDRLSKKFGYSC